MGRITKCPARYVRADRLDALVWQAVCELLESPEAILKEYALWEQAHRGASEQLRGLIEGLVSRQQRYQKQIKRLIDAYQQGVLTLAELAEHKAYLEKKIASLQREMQELEGQQKQTVRWERLVQNIGEFRQLLAANLSELSFEQRQALVQLLVEKVVVTGEEVDIYHILPFEEPPRPVPSREGYDMSCDVTCDTQSEGEFEGPSQPTPTQEKVSTLPSGDFYRLRLKHQNLQTVSGVRTTDRVDKDPQSISVQEEAIVALLAWTIHKWLDICRLEDPGHAQVEVLAHHLFRVAQASK